MLYVSAVAVGLLGFGQPVPAEASDVSQSSGISTDYGARAATTSFASDPASSILSSTTPQSLAVSSPSSAFTSATASSISVTTAPSSSHTTSTSTASLIDTETCQSKTINYITHTLPQQCLRTSWSSANATASIQVSDSAAAVISSESAAVSSAKIAHEADSQSQFAGKDQEQEKEIEKEKEDVDDQEDLATGSFMSFEEWKVLQLKKAGQDPSELQARRRHQQQQRAGQHAHGAGGDINIDSIGDDGEIALDFDVLNEKVSEMAGTAAAQTPGQYYEGRGSYQRYGQAGSGGDGANGASGTGGQQDKAVVYADGATQYYRSKDAGKTGKERFSFTSFDAGATILKTNKGVKNAKAILVENKDSYMLLECRTRDKYVIVEMSDDILVDTVVVANFEFFSSMVRRFRVSVSDRYPVKADRWRTLGEFEARNSRDIQPFLIEHPQIWAKYIRIEFLTHYGSEYYCPVSLLRVHGTRMLDSWKDSENGRDDDEEMEQEDYQQQQYQQQQTEQQQTEQQQTEQQQTEQQQMEQQQTEQQQTEQQQLVEENVVEPVQANTEKQEISDAATVVDNMKVNVSTEFTPWNPITAHLMLFESDTVCPLSSAPASSAAHWAVSGASQYGQPNYSSHQADRQDSGDNAQPSRSSSATEYLASQPSQKSHNAANDVTFSSPTSPLSAPATTGASSLSTSSSSLQSSDSSSATSAAAAINHADQHVAANNATVQSLSGSKIAINQQKYQAVPGTPEDSQASPTSTVPTSQTKNRAAAGGSNIVGGSSHASASTHNGPGSNPGATGSSGSSAAGNGNNNNNGGGSAPGSSGGASSAPPPPVVQESFFKSITKRLQLLESNTSLSLQYIEDQSRFLQEALRKMERKQISRVDLFLNTLNNTVLSELRSMRQQYDQIWQSTVIALETQREQNQRETVALSDRLNVLADEVVFQKRMAILQSALLLCCLALVIFSRGLLSSGSPSIPLDVNAAAAGYMPMPPGPSAMSPSPSSPPSAPSSSFGFRSNLSSRRYNFRDPYTDRTVYSPGYPLQGYSAGSPPPPHNSSLRMEPSIPVDPGVGSNGGQVHETAPVLIDRNKLLPQTPMTPTSPGSPLLPESTEMEGSRDKLVDTNDSIELHDVQPRVSENLHAVPRSLTPPASVRLSDIEEAADPIENESETDSNKDQENALPLSENISLDPDGSSANDTGDCDLNRRTSTPPLAADSKDGAPLPTESQKRFQLLPKHSSD